jgi:hypothetical protein
VELALTYENVKGYTVSEGVIRYKGRICLGNNKLAQEHVLQSLHDSAIGGHSGFQATYQRIKALFAWPKMKEVIRTYVRSCSVCQQAKSEHIKIPGLLQPLPVPQEAWSIVCVDFIEGLPPSNRYNTIMVVIDKFTKYAHFVPLVYPFTALQVAQHYMDSV